MSNVTPSPKALPSHADVLAAADRIKVHCIETPLLESPYLNRQLGGRLLVKAESLQTTGSFKLRGAVNRIAAMNETEKQRGVVARSSGNHGLALAYCSQAFGVSVVVVAPDTAPEAKVKRIKDYGARVVQVPMKDLASVAAEITAREQRILVPPADDLWVVSGAGTVGLEMARQARRVAASIDVVLTCCSGGGLTAGMLLGLAETSPTTRVHAVEAVGFEKMARSLEAGRRIDLKPGGHSICDAINGLYMAEIPFEIIKSRLAGTLAVTDDDALTAMKIAYLEFGLIVEPGGAVALAAVLTGGLPLEGRTVAVVFSGRNVDPPLVVRALT